jgi:hypothetical protein
LSYSCYVNCYSYLSTTFALKLQTSKVSESIRLCKFLPSVCSVHELQETTVQIWFLSAQIQTRKYLHRSISTFPRERNLASRILSQSEGQNIADSITSDTIFLCTSKWTRYKHFYALRYNFWLFAESATVFCLRPQALIPRFAQRSATAFNRRWHTYNFQRRIQQETPCPLMKAAISGTRP